LKQIILGTAGHIDHGKTSLIKAISGTDTDRLKEEKERGITIELGFAALDLPSGQHLGIVDVPGHEKFVKNMVAGATGIDIVMMVIAADEGVMPQTREHMEICALLGVQHGLIALTKTDMVANSARGLFWRMPLSCRYLPPPETASPS
jgi:selenocysteine-specific elongation factor